MVTGQTRLMLLVALVVSLAPVRAEDGGHSRGQLLYVPVYSEVPYGDKGLTVNLSATVSIRNTDSKTPITIKRVDYFGSNGALLHSYLKHAEVLKPMAAVDHVVRESDRSGGSSASFLVEWESEIPVSYPVVEAVMLNLTYNTGFAFSSQARILDQRP